MPGCDWKCTFKVAEYLKGSADKLQDHKQRFHRAAMARGYYSAFQRAKIWALEQSPAWVRRSKDPDTGKNISEHEDIWSWISRKTGVAGWRQHGHVEAHGHRCWADYEIGREFESDDFDEGWARIEALHSCFALLEAGPWPTDPELEVLRKAEIDDLFRSAFS